MLLILHYIKETWRAINRIHPETRTLIIVLLFGYVLYLQINRSTYNIVSQRSEYTIQQEKEAEQYTKDTAIEVNRHVRLISHKDNDAFDVLLLSYHNSKSSLQGYKFLYLSCIAESPKSLDVPLIGSQWNNLDYIYYVDELEKIHNQEIVIMSDIDNMKQNLPKLYRLVKQSDAEAASFYVIEGKNNPIGIVVCLYKNNKFCKADKAKIIMPSIQKLAILLDYENK